MSESSKAVFLSYASQDAEAVLRIAEAFPPSAPSYCGTRRAKAGVGRETILYKKSDRLLSMLP